MNCSKCNALAALTCSCEYQFKSQSNLYDHYKVLDNNTAGQLNVRQDTLEYKNLKNWIAFNAPRKFEKIERIKEVERKKIAAQKLENQIKQGNNSWPIKKKKDFMESLLISKYMDSFSKVSIFCESIKEIRFSNDGKFSFVSKYYLGIFK